MFSHRSSWSGRKAHNTAFFGDKSLITGAWELIFTLLQKCSHKKGFKKKHEKGKKNTKRVKKKPKRGKNTKRQLRKKWASVTTLNHQPVITVSHVTTHRYGNSSCLGGNLSNHALDRNEEAGRELTNAKSASLSPLPLVTSTKYTNSCRAVTGDTKGEHSSMHQNPKWQAWHLSCQMD